LAQESYIQGRGYSVQRENDKMAMKDSLPDPQGKRKPRQPPVFKQFLTDNKRQNKKKDGNGKETGADGRMIAEHVLMIRLEQAMHRMNLLCTFQ
jgi:hypothetical protein